MTKLSVSENELRKQQALNEAQSDLETALRVLGRSVVEYQSIRNAATFAAQAAAKLNQLIGMMEMKK